jgi:hypothetical protein
MTDQWIVYFIAQEKEFILIQRYDGSMHGLFDGNRDAKRLDGLTAAVISIIVFD